MRAALARNRAGRRGQDQRRTMALALAMAGHPRLGAASPARALLECADGPAILREHLAHHWHVPSF